jgi:hypothetical protein
MTDATSTTGNAVALDMDLDPIGKQPTLFKLYTQLAYIFSVPDDCRHSTIVETLQRGLERLSTQFPWIAGQVVNTNSDSNSTPSYKIRPFEPTPRLIVKDLTKDSNAATFSLLKEARYPMSMLHESVWAPCPTLAGIGGFDPAKPSGDGTDPAPVFLLQATFIKGGLVLCINEQHNVADMSGQDAMTALLSKACRNEAFTEEELRIGNMDRSNMVPLIEEKDWMPGKELEPQLLPSNPLVDAGVRAPPPTCSWTCFTFSAAALDQLKIYAIKTLPQDFEGYITTDDALTALIFQSVLRVRLPRLLSDPTREVTCTRAVDARQYFNAPSSYPGMLNNITYTTYPLSKLLSVGLGAIAAEMREQVNPKTCDLAYRTRSLVTFISQTPENQAKISFTAKIRPDADVTLSSWSKVKAYDCDFGLGMGEPEAVLRPAFVPVESLFYLMPKTRGGEIAAALCLRDEDLERLKRDGEFNRFASFVG